MRRRQFTALERQQIAERAYDCCEYCQSLAAFATQSFTIEHIWPLVKGGTNHLDNLALACPGCNAYKGDKTEAIDPFDNTLAPLFNPRTQRWIEHFIWSDDYTLLFGLTATGRATIDALHMNRRGLVNLREALFLRGKHPPVHAIND